MERVWTDNAEDEGKVQTTNCKGSENYSSKKIRWAVLSLSGASPESTTKIYT